MKRFSPGRWARFSLRLSALCLSCSLYVPSDVPGALPSGAKAESDRPDMVRVEGGSFAMGDLYGDPKHEKALPEVPVHEVELDPYEIGRYEVTVANFRQFIEETGYVTSAERPSGRPDPGNWRNHPYRQADNEPAVDVSWDDAIRYCNWLNRKHGLPRAFDEKTGAVLDAQGNVTADVRKVPGYRLPTEAEWRSC